MQNHEYQVTLKGIRPLLMNWDNLEWADELVRWKNEQGKLPAKERNSKAGDDRSPAWRWLGATYNDGVRVTIPSENIQRMCMEGATMISVDGGKKTFKAQSQSGMMPVESDWPLLVRGKEIPWAQLADLQDQEAFGLHVAKAKELGFRLFMKRARIGSAKHVRVRPRFDEWSATGVIRVWDEQITENILRLILNNGGRYKGLGDWRPGSKTPGSFGMFEANVRGV